jgi:hypothetical protein
MFNTINKDKGKDIEKFEMAAFLHRFVDNREQYQKNGEFMIKIKDLRFHMDQEFTNAIK